MQVTSVKKYATPRLPTHDILEQRPELLRIVPLRWRSNPVVLAALTGSLLLLDSCRGSVSAATPAPVSKVAPMFVHGDGRGGYGCVAVAAPMYMTEDEARSIINEEAKRAGIEFKSPGITHPSVDMPVVMQFDDVVDRDSKGKILRPSVSADRVVSTLQMDGTDAKHRVSYEFVSREDFSEMSKKAIMVSTWISEDIQGTSALVRKGLAKAKPAGYSVVFYDPVAWNKHLFEPDPPDPGGSEPNSYEAARNDLRAQVKDFIKWLKGQGVI